MRSITDINRDRDRSRERRTQIETDLELANIASANGQVPQAGADERVANLTRGLERVDGELERLDDEFREALLAHASDQNTVDGDGARRSLHTAVRVNDGPAGALRAAALRANERADFMPEKAREHMERELRLDDDPTALLARFVVETSDRDYFRAFATWMRDPISGGHEWTPKEREAVRRVRLLERAMGLGAQGGAFLVPYELDPNILIAGAGAISPLREISRVTTTAYNTKKFVTSLGVTGTWTPEATEQTDDSPTLLQPSIDCKKGAAYVPVSIELFEDSDIAQQVGRVLADAKAVQEALGFTLTQTNGPLGIISQLVAAGGGTVIATGTNVLAQGDLYANQAALPARWRPNAKWMMNLSILNGYRQLPQATGLNYSIVDDSSSPPRALGWPVYENSNMDGTLSGGAADYLVLSGDFQQFAIVDRVGTSIELLPLVVGTNHRPTGQRGFYLHFRTGSDVLIPDAFRLSNFST